METNEILNAYRTGRRLTAYNDEELATLLTGNIAEAFGIAGKSYDAMSLSTMAAAIVVKLRKAGGFLTDKEVSLAINAGVFREYGEYFSISAVTVWDWIRGFIKSAERQEALTILSRIQGMQNANILSAGEVQKRNRAARSRYAARYWGHWRPTGTLYVPSIFSILETPAVVLIYDEMAFDGLEENGFKVADIEKLRSFIPECRRMAARMGVANPSGEVLKRIAKRIALEAWFAGNPDGYERVSKYI